MHHLISVIAGMAFGILAGIAPPPAAAANGGDLLQFGITPVILDQQTAFLDRWRDYLEKKLGQPVVFRQRSTYREITDLLLAGEIDFAWICGYPFMQFENKLELTVVPVYQGRPLYRSYLIVPARNHETRSIVDLAGRSFAYSDPDSNSGYLVPQYELHLAGIARPGFFRRDFFTWSHSKVVRAVAEGVAEGGAVDGYVWDLLARSNPELTGQTRVVWKSPYFGFPPIVHPRGLDPGTAQRMRDALLHMGEDEEGRALLERLNLDGFSMQQNSLFEGIRDMIRAVDPAAGRSGRDQPAP